jgi:hypothetical protein
VSDLRREIDADELCLIDSVVRGFRTGKGKWPVFQYVEGTVFQDNALDAMTIFRRCPILSIGPGGLGSYGWFRVIGQHPWEPVQGDQLALTVAGMSLSTNMKNDADRFVMLVGFLCERLRSFVPDPIEVVSIEVTSKQILEFFDSKSYPRLGTTKSDVAFLVELLQREPSTWNCQVAPKDDEESLITLNPIIRRYAGVTDVDDYVARLEDQLFPHTEVAEVVYPPGLALPEAIDYLNAVWQMQSEHMNPLISIGRAEASARLAKECSSSEEFDAGLSAFATVIDCLDVPGAGGRLIDLRNYLEQRLPEGSRTRAIEAVDDLRAVIDIRVWRQHDETHKRLETGMRRLNVRLPSADWRTTWSTVQWKSVRALNAIREEVERSDFGMSPLA